MKKTVLFFFILIVSTQVNAQVFVGTGFADAPELWS